MVKSELLYLSMEDVERVGITFQECIETVEASLVEYAKGNTELPAKQGLHPMPGCFTHAMSACVPGIHGLGMKYISYRPGNGEFGLSDSTALLVINDPDTLHPVCVMEAMWLTYIRTAAMAAVAAKYCANKNSRKVAYIGTGGLARWTLSALEIVMPNLQEAMGYDVRQAAIDQFISDMQGRTKCRLTPAVSILEALSDADIVISATPRPPKPFIKEEWWKPGCTVIPLDEISCWERECYEKADKLFADKDEIFKHMKTTYPDIQLKNEPTELCQVVAGNKIGRSDSQERIMMISDGIGIVDVTVGQKIYTLAKQRGIGQRLNFMKDSIPFPPKIS